MTVLKTTRKKNLVLFFVVFILWCLFDRVTKMIVIQFPIGTTLISSILGLFEFNVVHNYGIAWGAFSGQVSTIVFLTAVLCTLVFVFALLEAKNAPLLEMIALALLCGGGLGNLIDRLDYGFVLDFISPLFMDFPTFNVADIGITVGIILLIVSLVYQMATANRRGEAHDG